MSHVYMMYQLQLRYNFTVQILQFYYNDNDLNFLHLHFLHTYMNVYPGVYTGTTNFYDYTKP